MSILLASRLQRTSCKKSPQYKYSLFFSIITCLPRSHKESQSSKYNPATHPQMYAKYQPKRTCFLQTLLFIILLWSEEECKLLAKRYCLAAGCIKGVSTRQILPQNLIRTVRRTVRLCPGGAWLSALGFCITFFVTSVSWQRGLARVMGHGIPYQKHRCTFHLFFICYGLLSEFCGCRLVFGH